MTYCCIISLSFLDVNPLWAQSTKRKASPAQQTQAKKTKEDSLEGQRLGLWARQRFVGARAGIDLFGPARFLFDDSRIEYSGMFDAQFGRNIFVLEGGYGNSRKLTSNFDYRNRGGFVRLGMDFNFASQGSDIFYAGLRYGYGQMEHRLQSAQIESDYYPDQPVSNPPGPLVVRTHWMEGVVGMKVHLFYNIWTGYAFRVNIRLQQTFNDMLEPAWILGYGWHNYSAMAGFSYWVMYNFGPMPKKPKALKDKKPYIFERFSNEK